MTTIFTVTEGIRHMLLTVLTKLEGILLVAPLLAYTSIQTSPTKFSELGLLAGFTLPK